MRKKPTAEERMAQYEKQRAAAVVELQQLANRLGVTALPLDLAVRFLPEVPEWATYRRAR